MLDLVVDDEGDSLDAAERAESDDTIASASRSIRAGEGRRGADVLGELRIRSLRTEDSGETTERAAF